MELQRYKEILQKPEKHLLKTAKDMLRCFFRQLYISAYARTPCLTPGCQTYQDPDVRHAKTRVSDIPRPGCRTYPVRQSGKLASQRESISVKRGENVRTNSRKRQAAKQKVVRMPQARQMGGKFDRSNEVHT